MLFGKGESAIEFFSLRRVCFFSLEGKYIFAPGVSESFDGDFGKKRKFLSVRFWLCLVGCETKKWYRNCRLQTVGILQFISFFAVLNWEEGEMPILSPELNSLSFSLADSVTELLAFSSCVWVNPEMEKERKKENTKGTERQFQVSFRHHLSLSNFSASLRRKKET